MTEIFIESGDITMYEVGAIVNAANNTLLGGSGVDGAIHKAAGRKLKAACRPLNGCRTGDAKITPGFNLKAQFVIHAVGPIWRGGDNLEDKLLASCYTKSLELAIQKGIKTIAFPNISTGIYGFPKERAAKLVLETVNNFISQNPKALDKIYFVCFDKKNLELYQNAFNIEK